MLEIQKTKVFTFTNSCGKELRWHKLQSNDFLNYVSLVKNFYQYLILS